MENQIEELKEDLDSEKSARTKAEKQRRELGEVMELYRLRTAWEARWPPDRAVWVWALARDIVLWSWAKEKTPYSDSVSLHPGEFNACGNFSMD